jgi:hypothetical protein
MRRWVFLLGSVVFVALMWWLQGQADRIRYVIPANQDILYATTFNDGAFAADWTTEERRGYVSTITEDRLRLTIEQAVFMLPSRPDALRTTNRFSFRDFDYRVTTTALEGPENNSFGVIFRQASPTTYYIFYISSDGYYSVWRETPAGRIALSAWIPSEAINQGTDNITNTVRVLANGDTFRFFVNGTPLMVCVPDDPNGESTYVEADEACIAGQMQPTLTDAIIPTGKLGVIVNPFASGQLAVAFDNVVVRPPE